MLDKKEKTDILIEKLKRIASQSIRTGENEKAMAAIAFAGNYLYRYNQYYTDDKLEGFLCNISDNLKKKSNPSDEYIRTENIIFYDGFGLDTRGVALVYLNALGLNKYNVIYVANIKQSRNIPIISSLCSTYGFEMKFVDMSNYLVWTKQLSDLFYEFMPKAAFYYTTPYDVSGAVAFHRHEGLVDRYLVDLTDHAFWLGKCAADFFLGSRNMSASLQFYQRGISKSQMIKLDVNLLIESCEDHTGLPFDPIKTDYIFSGGSLYKTLGDPENRYYQIVEHILSHHSHINFLYAGTGDDTKLRKIVERYPNRAFHINERKDFYYLIQNCTLYLNTYPMFGGMMMRYCALAHRIPITLKHGNDSDGLLLRQEECRIEYSLYEELVDDVDKLLTNNSYRKIREDLLAGSVITEEGFKNNIKQVIEEHRTDYEHEFLEIDTIPFRKEYYDRFIYEDQMMEMVKRINSSLCSTFPVTFIKGFIKKSYKRFKQNRRNSD